MEGWGEEDREGPAAAAGGGLHVGHVDPVHVGTLFPVYLDADKRGVQEFGSPRVVKRLARHHMAPVAGGVPDGKEDGFVLLDRLLERLFPPGKPRHGLMRMLQKVGRALSGQSVARRFGAGRTLFAKQSGSRENGHEDKRLNPAQNRPTAAFASHANQTRRPNLRRSWPKSVPC